MEWFSSAQWFSYTTLTFLLGVTGNGAGYLNIHELKYLLLKRSCCAPECEDLIKKKAEPLTLKKKQG
jgi:hypothetical protein